MQKTNLTLTLLAILFLIPGISQAQDSQPITHLAYMNASNGSEYVEMEREIWKPIHAQRVEKGEILGWYLYGAINTDGSNSGYNYLTVEVYPDWNSLEAPYDNIGDMFEGVHGSENMDAMVERTENARDIVKTELWSRVSGVANPDMTSDMVKYIVVDWMDVQPGKLGTYIDMENEYYKPMHQKRVDNEDCLTWSLFVKMGYSEAPGSVDAATSAAFKSWADIGNQDPGEAWESAHPNVDQDAVYERMLKQRAMVGSTIFKRIDYVEKQ